MSATISDHVLAHYRHHPERVYVRCIDAGGSSEVVTYGRLVERGAQLSAAMATAGSPPGGIVVIILPHSPDLYCALFGAILGGRVPALLAVPSFKIDRAHHARELEALCQHLGASAFVTDTTTAAELDLTGPSLSRAHIVHVDRIPPGPASVPEVRPAPEDTAVIQHSSGSTGLRKGVALSHRSLIRQVATCGDAIGLRSDDRIASWLPLYHDMGLVACAIMPALTGTAVTAVGPLHWVRRPASILHAISDDRCTLAWMPNFAFEFLSARVRESELAGVSLATMRGWINCAEPTLAETHRRFVRRYAAHGVRSEHLWTCYAAAETTFAMTQSSDRVPPQVEHLQRDAFLGRGLAVPVDPMPAGAVEVMSAGVPLSGTSFRIVDAGGVDLPERRVGEIVVRSESLFEGYFRRPDLTSGVLRDGWYHSGDFGYCAGGHLFVTGRKDDLIIIAGRNYYPQDIERIVGQVAGIHDGRVVALGVDDPAIGTQRLVVIAEVDDPELVDSSELATRVREALAARMDCTIADLRLVPRMWLVKTSSGKIARTPNRARYLREFVGA